MTAPGHASPDHDFPVAPSARRPVTIFSASDHGHRRDYRTVLTALFAAEAPCGVTEKLGAALLSRRAFFDMLDDRALAFLVIAALRSCVGLRTAGLFFRSGECFRPG